MLHLKQRFRSRGSSVLWAQWVLSFLCTCTWGCLGCQAALQRLNTSGTAQTYSIAPASVMNFLLPMPPCPSGGHILQLEMLQAGPQPLPLLALQTLTSSPDFDYSDYKNIMESSTYRILADPSNVWGCPLNCSGNGLCNTRWGKCDCRSGWAGNGCTAALTPSNQANTEQTLMPGKWVYYSFTVRSSGAKVSSELRYTSGNPTLFVKHEEDGFLPFGVPDEAEIAKFGINLKFPPTQGYQKRVLKYARSGRVFVGVYNNGSQQEPCIFTVNVNIEEDSQSSDGLSLTAVSIVCIVVPLFAMFLLTLICCSISKTDGSDHMESSNNQQVALNAVPELADVEFSAELSNSLHDNQCAVCLNDYVVGEMLRPIPVCGHFFHVSCVEDWLGRHNTCPICRALFTTVSPAVPAINPTSHHSNTTFHGPNEAHIVTQLQP